MIVYRFCSLEEYNKLMKGEMLENHTKHSNKTTSVGFCFTPYNPEQAIHFLSGNVDTEICLTLEIDVKLLKKTYGEYVNHKKLNSITSSYIPTQKELKKAKVKITEYCTEEYSLSTVKVIDATTKYSNLPGRKASEALLRALGYTRYGK